MKNKDYLDKDYYLKIKKSLSIISLSIFIVGIIIGGSFITLGVIHNGRIANHYSKQSRKTVQKNIYIEKRKLVNKKHDLEASGITYNSNSKSTDKDLYDLKIITEVLDPSFYYCAFEEYATHHLTAKYCSLREQENDLDKKFSQNARMFSSVPLLMFGIFIIISFSMIAGFLFHFSKKINNTKK